MGNAPHATPAPPRGLPATWPRLSSAGWNPEGLCLYRRWRMGNAPHATPAPPRGLSATWIPACAGKTGERAYAEADVGGWGARPTPPPPHRVAVCAFRAPLDSSLRWKDGGKGVSRCRRWRMGSAPHVTPSHRVACRPPGFQPALERRGEGRKPMRTLAGGERAPRHTTPPRGLSATWPRLSSAGWNPGGVCRCRRWQTGNAPHATPPHRVAVGAFAPTWIPACAGKTGGRVRFRAPLDSSLRWKDGRPCALSRPSGFQPALERREAVCAFAPFWIPACAGKMGECASLVIWRSSALTGGRCAGRKSFAC